MALRKQHSAILLLLALVTVPFLMVASLVFQYRLDTQADFLRLLSNLQVFRQGLAVVGPLERVRDLAPAALGPGSALLTGQYQAARAETRRSLDAFIAAVSQGAVPGLLDQAGVLRREWRELAPFGATPGNAEGAFEDVERVNDRLYSSLAAVLYMSDTGAEVRPNPNEVLALPLNGLRHLAYDVGILRAVAVYASLSTGVPGDADARALNRARARLAEQIRLVDGQVGALADRAPGFALKSRWRSLRASLNGYLKWVDTNMVEPPRITVAWTDALAQGGRRLGALNDFDNRLVDLSEVLVRRAHRQSVLDTVWIMVALALLYVLILGLSLAFFFVNARALRSRAEVRAKSQFLARMSHEIRTPLNGVLGLAELLRETNPSPRQQEYIGLIENAGRTLNTLVNDVLDYAKLEAGKLELELDGFDPAALLIDCAHLFSLPASDNGDLILVDVDPQLPAQVLGDAPRLRQVLTNLLSNAVKFTRRGWIRVSVRCRKMGDRYAALEWRVVDNGIGMTRDEQRRLFRHFSQASAAVAQRFGGTGLGLSISQELVRLMGAEIELRSAPGEGADFRFTIELPIRAEAVPMPQRNADPAVVWDRVGNLGALLRDDPRFRDVTVVADAEAVREELEKGATHLLINGLNDGMELDRAVKTGRRRGPAPRPVVLCGMRESGEMAMRDDINLVRRAVLTVSELQQLLSDDGPGPVPLLARREPEEGQSGLRVLIAEDNPVNQMVTRGYLERLGVAGAVLSDDGQQALDAFAAAEGGYRLVLMDLDMPVMDGFASARAMRDLEAEHHWRPAVILALSAHVLPDYVGRIQDAGMDGQLIKPLTLSALQAALHEYLAG